MEQSSDLVPDLAWIDRRIRAIRRAMVPGTATLITAGCLAPVVGFGLAFAFGSGHRSWSTMSGLIGTLAAAVLLILAARRERRYGAWYRGEAQLGVFVDFTHRSSAPDDPDRAVLLVSGNRDAGRDADYMLDLHNDVLAWFDEGEGTDGNQDENEARGVTFHEWLDKAREQLDIAPLRIPRRIAGDGSSCWLVVARMWPDNLPPDGDEGVVMVPVLRSRPKDTTGSEAGGGCLIPMLLWTVLGGLALPFVILGAIRETRELGQDSQTARQARVPRVRPIPARFWNEQMAVPDFSERGRFVQPGQ